MLLRVAFALANPTRRNIPEDGILHVRPDLANLSFEERKYGNESHGTRTQEGMGCQYPAANVNYRPILSSEKVAIITNPQLYKQHFKENGNIDHWSQMVT
jgi:hypothetical protein